MVFGKKCTVFYAEQLKNIPQKRGMIFIATPFALRL
jgi:hypothetical protein